MPRSLGGGITSSASFPPGHTSNHISSPPCAHSSVVPSLPPPPSVEDLEEERALTMRSLGTHRSRGTAPSEHSPNYAIRSKRCMKPSRYGGCLSQQLAHPDTLFYPVAALLPGEHRITWAIQGTKTGGREARCGLSRLHTPFSAMMGTDTGHPRKPVGGQVSLPSSHDPTWASPSTHLPARSPQVHTPGH